MGRECNNCGSFVTARYARVLGAGEGENPDVCPWCPDMRRSKGKAEPARGKRRGQVR